MKHSGLAWRAGLRVITVTLILLALLFAAGLVATLLGSFIVGASFGLLGIWAVFAVFTLYFFRDPNPDVPLGAGLVVSPAHGKVDVIDQTEEPRFMGGRCQRISIFLSVFNVHVQNAPVAGVISLLHHKDGQFLNAMKIESAEHNEHVLIGIDAGNGVKIGVRLIAGLIARRIVPFVSLGDSVGRGERISLIQFGSRVNLYLPLDATVKVSLGDKVVGGETVIAQLA